MAGGSFESDRDDFESQDQSEALDEANTVGDGDQGEVRTFAEADARGTFEEMPDVMDLLQVEGDRDDDEAVALDADEFDPDAVGDADLAQEPSRRAAAAEREPDLDGEDFLDIESDAKGG